MIYSMYMSSFLFILKFLLLHKLVYDWKHLQFYVQIFAHTTAFIFVSYEWKHLAQERT